MDERTAFHRVDAARRLMHIPARAKEGLGRLYVAKRVHEAIKAGHLDVQAILADVLESTDDPAVQAGARKEADFALALDDKGDEGAEQA